MFCLQLPCLGEATVGKGDVVARARQFGKLGEHVVEEERQPDAFAAALFAHQVHAVVPVAAAHQRQTVFAEFQSVFDGAHAMLVERGRLFGAIRQIIVSFLLRLDRPAFEKGNLFVEHAGVGDARDVAAGDVRQPQIVVGKMRAHAAARRGMPPMLHIAFAELMRGGAQQMLAGEGRFGMHQRHHVLQLVAESVGAAGLIKPGAAPEPAAQGLIQQPAVGHHIHGGIGRFDVHRAERSVPILPDAFERARLASARRKRWIRFCTSAAFAPDSEAKAGFPFLPVRQIEGDLHRAARIQPGADLAGKPRALQRRRLRQAAVSAERTPSDPGEGARRIVHINERDAFGELGVVVIACQQRAGLEVHLGLHVQQAFVPQVAQAPIPSSR